MPPGMVEMQIAADDRLDRRRFIAPPPANAPSTRLEIEQMRHQRVQVAGQAQFAPLDKGEQVVIAGRRVGGQQAAPDRRPRPRSRTRPTALRTDRAAPRRSGRR